MINPTFNTTITIYHQCKYFDENIKKNVITWERAVYDFCFYNNQIAENLSGNNLTQASTYITRIPYTGTTLSFSPGDIVIKGIATDIIEDSQGKRTTDLIKKYKPDCFVVRAVSDNTKIQEDAHYKLTGV